MLSEPFSPEQVKEVSRRLYDQSGFSEWRTRQQNRHDLRFRLHPVNIRGLGGKLEDRSPAILEHGLRYINRFDAAKRDIEVFERSSEPAAQKAAQKIEDFSYAVWEDWDRRRTSHLYAPARRRLNQQVFDGCGILRLGFAPGILQHLFGEALDDAEEMKKLLIEAKFGTNGFNPFVLECPDLGACAWEQNLSRATELGEVTVSDVLGWQDGLGYDSQRGFHERRTSDTMQEFESWWDDKAYIYHLETEQYIYDVVEGTEAGEDGAALMVSHYPNLAKRPWYALTPGHLTESRHPAEMFYPVVGALYGIVERRNLLATLLNSGALNTGRNMFQEVDVSARRADDITEVLSRPANETHLILLGSDGETLPPPAPGKRWEPVQIPDQRQVIAALEKADQDILMFGFPAVLDPNMPIDATSGSDRARQMEASSTFLSPPLENRAAADKELVMLGMDLIQALEMPVTIYARRYSQGTTDREEITVKPGDGREQDMTFAYRSIPATQRYSEQEADLRLHQAGFLSRRTLMQTLHEDWQAEEEDIHYDAAATEVDAMALQDAIAALQEARPDLMQQAALEAGLPLVNPAGGPAPGQETRNERPPEGAVSQGLGAANFPFEQRADGVPPSVGTGPEGQA